MDSTEPCAPSLSITFGLWLVQSRAARALVSRLILLIMEHYGVNMEGQKRTAIHSLDTVNIIVLRSLKFSPAIINAIERGEQADGEE